MYYKVRSVVDKNNNLIAKRKNPEDELVVIRKPKRLQSKLKFSDFEVCCESILRFRLNEISFGGDSTWNFVNSTN